MPNQQFYQLALELVHQRRQNEQAQAQAEQRKAQLDLQRRQLAVSALRDVAPGRAAAIGTGMASAEEALAVPEADISAAMVPQLAPLEEGGVRYDAPSPLAGAIADVRRRLAGQASAAQVAKLGFERAKQGAIGARRLAEIAAEESGKQARSEARAKAAGERAKAAAEARVEAAKIGAESRKEAARIGARAGLSKEELRIERERVKAQLRAEEKVKHRAFKKQWQLRANEHRELLARMNADARVRAVEARAKLRAAGGVGSPKEQKFQQEFQKIQRDWVRSTDKAMSGKDDPLEGFQQRQFTQQQQLQRVTKQSLARTFRLYKSYGRPLERDVIKSYGMTLAQAGMTLEQVDAYLQDFFGISLEAIK